MHRFAWVVGIVAWLSSFAVADVIIFNDGSRMEVQSFEIKDGLVLIKTMAGKLQSLPRAYVNVDATQRANRGEEASAPTPVKPPVPPQPPVAPEQDEPPEQEEPPALEAPSQPPVPEEPPTPDEPPEPVSKQASPVPAKPPMPPSAPSPPAEPVPRTETPPSVWSDEELKISVVIPSTLWQVETQSSSFDVAVRLDNSQSGGRATLALVRERMRNYGDFKEAFAEIENSVSSSATYQPLRSGLLPLDPYTAHEIRYLRDVDGATYYNRMVVYYSRDMAYILSMSCPQDNLEQNEADFEELVKGLVIKKVRKDITPKGVPN